MSGTAGTRASPLCISSAFLFWLQENCLTWWQVFLGSLGHPYLSNDKKEDFFLSTSIQQSEG